MCVHVLTKSSFPNSNFFSTLSKINNRVIKWAASIEIHLHYLGLELETAGPLCSVGLVSCRV